MHTNFHARVRKLFLGFLLTGIILTLFSASGGASIAQAQKADPPTPNSYYTVTTISLDDGTSVNKHIINGPSVPPVGFEEERQPVTMPDSNVATANGLSGGVGGSSVWVLGCSATAAGDILAIFDQERYTNLYDGLLPIGYNPWPTNSDCMGGTVANNPVIASRQGLDGRTTLGTMDDYYISYENGLPDPYLGYGGGSCVPAPSPREDDLPATALSTGWAQHAWGDAVGDYMYTSQSAFGNIDGATQFYTYASSATPYTCEEMSKNALPDGALGLKQFYQARGYAVGTCYNQPTDNVISGGFSFAQFKAEINAGRPVMLHLEGHTVVGVNYNAATNQIYIHDGWDYETHAMTWGGSYAGMGLQSVSIVNIVPGVPNSYTISGNVGVPNATITYTSGFTIADSNGNYSFTVTDGWFGTVTPSKDGYNFTPPSRSYKNVRQNHTAQNYIATDSDFPGTFGKISPVNGVLNQPDELVLSWGESLGTASYEYCYDTTNDNACTNWMDNGSSTTKALPGLSGNTTYYWHVRAVNPSGTTYGNDNATAFWSFKTAPLTPVQNLAAWTGDGSWNLKSSFRPGDDVQWGMTIENTTGSARQVTLIFVVKNPSGATILNWQALDTIDNGLWGVSLLDTATNEEGTYTLNTSVIYQGIRTDQSATYTITIPCYTLSRSIVPDGTGTINLNPPPNCNNGTQYREGTIVQLTAFPYSGYALDSWSGDLTGSSNTGSVTMNGDRSVTANFGLIPPAAPQLKSPSNGANLTATKPTLDWNDIPLNLNHYQVQVATQSDFNGGILHNQNTTESSYTIPTMLVAGNVYYWHVRAFNELGQSGDWSETWQMSIKLTSVNLQAPAVNASVLTLRPSFDWSDIPNAGFYTIQVSKNNSFTQIVMSEPASASSSTPTNDLPAAQTLYWRVRVEGASGSSNWSEVQTFRTPNPPHAPVLAAPNTDAVVTGYKPLFKWNPVSVPRGTQFDHYQIQVSTDKTFSTLTINQNLAGLSTKMYSPSIDLTANTQYYWRMQAYNTNDEVSGWSEVRTFTTPRPVDNSRPRISNMDPTIPLPVLLTPLNKKSVSTLRPVLDWTDVPGATSYIVQVSADPNFGNFTFLVSATSVESQYAYVKDVPSDTTLYWRVLMIKGGSFSDWSTISTFRSP